jgi:hypothetical protein
LRDAAPRPDFVVAMMVMTEVKGYKVLLSEWVGLWP